MNAHLITKLTMTNKKKTKTKTKKHQKKKRKKKETEGIPRPVESAVIKRIILGF